MGSNRLRLGRSCLHLCGHEKLIANNLALPFIQLFKRLSSWLYFRKAVKLPREVYLAIATLRLEDAHPTLG